jgi:hypothetical protein
MALTVRTILGVCDVPTSRPMRSSMVSLPEQVERIGKCRVLQAARPGLPPARIVTLPRIALRLISGGNKELASRPGFARIQTFIIIRRHSGRRAWIDLPALAQFGGMGLGIAARQR